MKIIAIGDSITHGTYTNIGESAPLSLATPYCKLIADKLNASQFINYGMNGVAISHTSKVNSEYAIENRVDSFECADLILFMAGTNDFGTDVKLKYFEKAVTKTFNILKTKCSSNNIVIILPTPRNDEKKNKLGLSLKNYSEILKMHAKTNDFKIVDGHKVNINPLSNDDRNTYIFDGVHLNDLGHKLLADLVIKEAKLNFRKEVYEFAGHEATVIIPDSFNGEWIWKTEFFYAFDKLEASLCEKGFARVYYQISDMYGSPKSIELMYEFYKDLIKRFGFQKQCYMIGFSRGALYAFNFALAHEDIVKRMYLDAPVLDLRTWPHIEDEYEHTLYEQVLEQYGFASHQDYLDYKKYPVDRFEEYFDLNIPTLLVAGKDDTLVPFDKNGQKMIDYANKSKIKNFYYFVKVGSSSQGGDHHPHSFGNKNIKLIYGCDAPDTFRIYSNTLPITNKSSLMTVRSDESILMFFFKHE